MFAARIRAMGAVQWIGLFGVVLGAWAILFAMAAASDALRFETAYGSGFWAALCQVTPDAAGFGRLILMWAVMTAAMMLPTALPALTTYDDLSSTGADTRMPVLAAGYMAVWLGFAVVAAGGQLLLTQAGLVGAIGTSQSNLLSAGLLALAGFYQFSALKEACASACRAPLLQFMAHWDEGPWRMGLRMGLTCLGCCWALMLLAFVGGTMNLAFMGLATVLMTLEKLPDFGRWLSQPLGGALIGASVVVALT